MEDPEKAEHAMRDPVLMAKKLDSKSFVQNLRFDWEAGDLA